jgi:hypothetical protein
MTKDICHVYLTNKELVGFCINFIILIILCKKNEDITFKIMFNTQESIFFCLLFISSCVFIWNLILLITNIHLSNNEKDLFIKQNFQYKIYASFSTFFIIYLIGLARFCYGCYINNIIGFITIPHIVLLDSISCILYISCILLMILLLILILYISKQKKLNTVLLIICYIFLGILSLLLIRPILTDLALMGTSENFFYKYLNIYIYIIK